MEETIVLVDVNPTTPSYEVAQNNDPASPANRLLLAAELVRRQMHIAVHQGDFSQAEAAADFISTIYSAYPQLIQQEKELEGTL